jgi:hypothetical protein
MGRKFVAIQGGLFGQGKRDGEETRPQLRLTKLCDTKYLT